MIKLIGLTKLIGLIGLIKLIELIEYIEFVYALCPFCSHCLTRNPQLDIRGQKTDDRRQITDAGNQISWIFYPRNSFDPPAPSIKRCLTLCPLLYALFTRNS
jgi:hypothetical protein